MLAGSTSLGLLGDEWVLAIMGSVASGRRRRKAILAVLRLSEGVLDERLRRLCELGLLSVKRQPGFPARVEYELSTAGCSLPGLALPGYCWEWRWGRPSRPQFASDLKALLRFTAPLLQLPADTHGVCELSVNHRAAQSTLLEIRQGAITVLAQRPRLHADARARARPLGWCSSLLDGGTSRLQISGSTTLVHRLIDALHRVLPYGNPCKPPITSTSSA